MPNLIDMLQWNRPPVGEEDVVMVDGAFNDAAPRLAKARVGIELELDATVVVDGKLVKVPIEAETGADGRIHTPDGGVTAMLDRVISALEARAVTRQADAYVRAQARELGKVSSSRRSMFRRPLPVRIVISRNSMSRAGCR